MQLFITERFLLGKTFVSVAEEGDREGKECKRRKGENRPSKKYLASKMEAVQGFARLGRVGMGTLPRGMGRIELTSFYLIHKVAGDCLDSELSISSQNLV